MKKTLTIKGMHCTSCKELIEEVSKEISGIQSCTVDVKGGKAVVVYEGQVDWGKLKKEIEALGEYKVTY